MQSAFPQLWKVFTVKWASPGLELLEKQMADILFHLHWWNINIIVATFLWHSASEYAKKNSVKSGFHTLQGTMSHRPLTNTSSLKIKITAAYCTLYKDENIYIDKNPELHPAKQIPRWGMTHLFHLWTPSSYMASSIEWFIEGQAFLGSYASAPSSPLPSASCLSFSVFLCAAGRAYLGERGREGGELIAIFV